jgi:hypothetical protein
LAGTPALVSTMAVALARFVQVLGTVWGAVRLILRSLLAGPTFLGVLAYLLVCGVLAVGWARLALLPRRVER